MLNIVQNGKFKNSSKKFIVNKIKNVFEIKQICKY